MINQSKNELIEKIMDSIKKDCGGLYETYYYDMERIKKILQDTLPSEQVIECERIYKSGVPRCSKCNSSLISAEIYCTGCGKKIKRID